MFARYFRMLFHNESLLNMVQGEDMKHNPEMGETAIQPVPAQTADLSISGLRFMSSPCTLCTSDTCDFQGQMMAALNSWRWRRWAPRKRI